MEIRTENLNDKNIRDFTDSDTLYIQKLERGYTVNYFVQFISFKSGVVKGKVLSVSGYGGQQIRVGEEITARIKNCYLWGKDEIDVWRERCHWFDTDGNLKRSNSAKSA